MCTPRVNALQDFNINNTQNTNKFQLHMPDLLAACNQQGPLIFCLNPPSNRLQTMCETPTLDPYFDSVLQNQDGITLDDLPVVWDSLQENSEDPWIEITNYSSQYTASDGVYYGLQPLPDFMSIAASGGSRKLFGVAGGVFYMTNSSTGFMEPSDDVRGANDQFQRVFLNAEGSFGCVVFSNTIFLYQNNNFLRILPSTQTTKYVWAGMTQTNTNSTWLCILAQESDSLIRFFMFQKQIDRWMLISSPSLELTNLEFVTWTCLTKTNGYVAIGVQNSNVYRIFEVSLATPTSSFLLRWTNVPWAENIVPIPNVAWDAVMRDSETQVFVTTTNKYLSKAQIVVLQKFVPLSSAQPISGFVHSIENSLQQDFFSFLLSNDGQEHVALFVSQTPNEYVASPTVVTGIVDLNWNGNSCFASDQQKFWYISPQKMGSHLSHNILTNASFGTNFLSNFDLNTPFDAHISDFGLPTIVLQPRTTWFFGYSIVSHAQRGLTYLSPHQYYRLVIDEKVDSSENAFPHVTTHLQRANFRVLAMNQIVNLSSNSQTCLLNIETKSTFWARNTTDSWGEAQKEEDTQIIFSGRESRCSSRNGLYIFYTPAPEFGVGARVVVNIFNSSAFALYCGENAPSKIIGEERRAKALQQQALFCKNQLKQAINLETRDISNLFLDKRCVCINTPELMHELYPSLNDLSKTKPWNTNLARMNSNFPCMSKVCQEAIAQPEVTNVYRSTQERCQSASLTLCTGLLNKLKGATLEVQSGILLQHCNGAVGSQCGQDEMCPLGSACVNGKCTTNCISNTDCGPMATCLNGVCVTPAQDTNNAQNSYSNLSRITFIVLISIVLLVLIALIVVAVKRK